jgi:hypothetical protein
MDDLHVIYGGPKAFDDVVQSVYANIQPTLTRDKSPLVIAGRAGRGPQYAVDVMGNRTGETSWPVNAWKLVRQLVGEDPESALIKIRELIEQGDGTKPVRSEGLDYRSAVYHPTLDAIIVSPEAMALLVAQQPIQRADPGDEYKLQMFTGNVHYDLAEALVRWDFGNRAYNKALQNGEEIKDGPMGGVSIRDAKVRLEIEGLETVTAALAVRRRWRKTIKPQNRVIDALQTELERGTVQEFLMYARVLAEDSFAQKIPVSKLITQAQSIN